MAKLMSKSELIQKIADQHSNGLSRKDIKGVIESLASVGYKELKKTGAFFVPGFAKFVVIKKPATKQRTGINPFTKEPTVFKAKPARKVIRARPVKAVKDAVAGPQLSVPGCEFRDAYLSRYLVASRGASLLPSSRPPISASPPIRLDSS
jgi:DNA-binding protein HU-beta